MRFQWRSWIIQRCCWILMLVIVIGALGGLFGSGTLTQTISASKTFTVGYEPFAQYTAPTKLVFQIEQFKAQQPIRIHINQPYARSFKFEHIFPSPEEIAAGGDWVVFSFFPAVNGPMYVTFDVKPEQIGRLQAKIVVEGAEPVTFSQFVYP